MTTPNSGMPAVRISARDGFSSGMSKTLSRFERLQMTVAHERLAEAPLHIQAEAIAHHYVSVACLARDLMELVELRRHGAGDENTDAMIAMMVGHLQRAHCCDLGIELEWQRTKPKHSDA